MARVHRRFYAALQLRDLCNEMPVHAVAKKYDMPRGHVQNLAQTCEGFGAGIIKFCERMGWGMLAAVLEHMSDRLKAGTGTPYIWPRLGTKLTGVTSKALDPIYSTLPRSLSSRAVQHAPSGRTV